MWGKLFARLYRESITRLLLQRVINAARNIIWGSQKPNWLSTPFIRVFINFSVSAHDERFKKTNEFTDCRVDRFDFWETYATVYIIFERILGTHFLLLRHHRGLFVRDFFPRHQIYSSTWNEDIHSSIRGGEFPSSFSLPREWNFSPRNSGTFHKCQYWIIIFQSQLEAMIFQTNGTSANLSEPRKDWRRKNDPPSLTPPRFAPPFVAPPSRSTLHTNEVAQRPAEEARDISSRDKRGPISTYNLRTESSNFVSESCDGLTAEDSCGRFSALNPRGIGSSNDSRAGDRSLE